MLARDVHANPVSQLARETISPDEPQCTLLVSYPYDDTPSQTTHPTPAPCLLLRLPAYLRTRPAGARVRRTACRLTEGEGRRVASGTNVSLADGARAVCGAQCSRAEKSRLVRLRHQTSEVDGRRGGSFDVALSECLRVEATGKKRRAGKREYEEPTSSKPSLCAPWRTRWRVHTIPATSGREPASVRYECYSPCAAFPMACQHACRARRSLSYHIDRSTMVRASCIEREHARGWTSRRSNGLPGFVHATRP